MSENQWVALLTSLFVVFCFVLAAIVVVTDGPRHERHQCEDTTTHRYLLANYAYSEAVRLAELEC